MAARTVTVAERRARLGRRHSLASPARSAVDVAGRLCGLHGSDPASVFLAARARVRGFTVVDLEGLLYEERTLVRMLGMRRTIFVVPRDLAAVMDAACTKPLAAAERRRLGTLLEQQGITASGARWIRRVEERTLAVLAGRDAATASELTKAVPELTTKLSFGEGKTWAGTVGMSTRLLFLLAAEGRVVRGRPRGSWTSSQYAWAATDRWLGAPLPAIPAGEARAELARRYLQAFGPATQADLQWWAGWTKRDTTAALVAVDAVEVEIDTGAAYVLPDDLAPVRPPKPWVALLPSLDPTVMGWKERAWYLADHAPALFDRNGNAGPTVWCDGRIVGTWVQRASGEVAVGLVEDVDAAARARIDAEAAALGAWFGDTRVTTRFPTPLERSLA